ncbi:MAG TPA: Gfo/Idh/MocA family oxidoreductase, partial [Deinococcales bacterium]|nr:Gfo/Idh/MocA family oxidoreductase [Deinococcales bacterium]
MRVGVIGAGSMGTVHAAAWRQAGAVLAGVHAKDVDGGRALAAREGTDFLEDLDALIDRCEVVDVCAPTFLHRPLVEAAARAGRHVVCEKPIALSV